MINNYNKNYTRAQARLKAQARSCELARMSEGP